MKDFKLIIEVELHGKSDLSNEHIEIIKNGIKQLLTGASEKSYSKVVKVEIEEVKKLNE